ncbi:hypothetical protein [Nevskia sp.]|uniref:hypothetical protein n=1 Tax=Nevskia sp. TaxID=1929292 RepID=UPI0025EC119F|nr:hypothetical protein [Nevskia sp.]
MRDRFLGGLYRLMDSPLGAVLGGLVYGLWAFFVNRHAGLPHAALIGFTHWMMSVAITLGCVALMRTLFWMPARPRNGAWLSIAGSLLVTYTLLVSVHWYIGTPNILLTLAPGMLPTIGFAAIYSSLLLRESGDPRSATSIARRTSLFGTSGDPHARA